MSRRSFTLSSGIITVFTPPRRAASSFSFNPPMGRTLPRSVTSPVIATSRRTGIWVRTDTIEVTIAIPGRGAVLGRRALGHVDMDVDLVELGRLHAQIDGFRADDSSTPPRSIPSSRRPAFPVVFIRPLPGRRSASIDSRSPPTSVQARPVVTPIWSLLLGQAELEPTHAQHNPPGSRASTVTFSVFALDDLGDRLPRRVLPVPAPGSARPPRGCSSG